MSLHSDPEQMRRWIKRSQESMIERGRRGEGFTGKRKPLPLMSAKRRREAKERSAFVAMVLRQRPSCEARLPWVCTGQSREVNEIMRGPGREDCWLDWHRVTALCRPCHRWITAHPHWAYRHGHQLPHEADVPERDWAASAWLRKVQRVHPCSPECRVDHRHE